MDFYSFTTLNMIDKVSLFSGVIGICQALLQMQIAIMKSFGIVGDPPYNPCKDPFLKYYTVTCAWITLLLWIVMKYLDPKMKVIAVIMIFIFLILFSFGTVIFRKIFLGNYINNPSGYDIPIGFLHGPYNYWPYFSLIPFTIIVNIAIFIKYSNNIETDDTLIKILVCYISTLILLMIARLYWEIVESIALKEFTRKHPHIVEEYMKKLTLFRENFRYPFSF